MYIKRILEDRVKKKITTGTNKIIVIYGARQVGKTSLVKEVIKTSLNKQKVLQLNGEESHTSDVFSSQDLNQMKKRISGYDALFIDEAQKIKNIGVNLKILHDHMPDFTIIVTGSYTFKLASDLHEPLTGRTWTYSMYPVAFCEMQHHWPPYELDQQLNSSLVFGTYPELFSLESRKEKQEYLYSLCEDYLYKDVLEIDGIKNSQRIRNLLQLLAFQIGQEVSFTELGNRLGINKKNSGTVCGSAGKIFCYFFS